MAEHRQLNIYLLRHGECEGGEIIRGRSDVALSDEGKAQMWRSWRAISSALEQLPSQPERLALLSSPAQRCQAFAAELKADMPDYFPAPLQQHDWLWELDFGDWDGMKVASVYQQHSEAAEAFWRDPVANTPPGGESLPAFRSRVLDGWQTMVQRWLAREVSSSESSVSGDSASSASADAALILTHSGVIRLLLAEILLPGQMPPAAVFNALELPYAAWVRITLYASRDASGESDQEWQCFSKLHWPQ
ncbi:histidine phosphatase family protein [Shewanella algae]|uniref:histidine phosphatase family protein n=1 Tax=Shewanella algae TaxID=38313 RepID=UPI001AAC4DCC|nr:histidine phosphatase family protein [Shewanella algae]MBO2568100.1 histidine phosphatase family protein [Shewanella algae]MBO2656966.1 histidine phosphatase family protein [Shewanella algae]MBO2686555.1 histidine phosphatase family protein [Shewanella algae]MCE9781347.1 histidine phosphatase family protein [Shewanella algae]MCE9825771.1 histidine phosphatase family protein [Shewanella algae]